MACASTTLTLTRPSLSAFLIPAYTPSLNEPSPRPFWSVVMATKGFELWAPRPAATVTAKMIAATSTLFIMYLLETVTLLSIAFDRKVLAHRRGRPRLSNEARHGQDGRDVRKDKEYLGGQPDDAQALGAELEGVDESEKERGQERAHGTPSSRDVGGKRDKTAASCHPLCEGIRVLD